jgi:hypothetical protein
MHRLDESRGEDETFTLKTLLSMTKCDVGWKADKKEIGKYDVIVISGCFAEAKKAAGLEPLSWAKFRNLESETTALRRKRQRLAAII